MKTSTRRLVVAVAFVIPCGSVNPATATGSNGARLQNPVPDGRDCGPSMIVACPCPLSNADAVSGRFAVELLTAVSDKGRANALVSPLGIGAVLAMLSQGAIEPVRRSILEMVEAGGGQGRAETDMATTSESLESPGAEESRATANGRGGVDRDAGESPPEAVATGRGGAEDTLTCRLAGVLAAAREDPRVTLHVANAAFADRRLDLFPSFYAVLQDRFGAHVARLDFANSGAVPWINAWVARETANAIPSLVSHLAPDTALVLANAMHFHGEWSHPFDPDLTVPLPFHPDTGTASEVPTMQAEELSARYREGADFQAIALPYGGGDFALVVALPRAGLAPSDALRAIASDPTWLGGSGFQRTTGYLALPRVSLNEEASLLPVLRDLGLAAALENAEAFAGIAAPPPTLSQVVHRTMLKLDEQGTKAAAATAAVMTTRAAIPEDEGFEMRVDRPFTLAIRHVGTDALLFAAWVANPTGI